MEQTKRTQTSDILNYLRSHKNGITSKEAFEKYGATRLSGIIWSLRKQGYNIISEPKVVKSRYGKNTLVSAYKLLERDNA